MKGQITSTLRVNSRFNRFKRFENTCGKLGKLWATVCKRFSGYLDRQKFFANSLLNKILFPLQHRT